MVNEVTWKIGGQQGEGIESAGELFSRLVNRLGYYLYGYRHFSSRIQGGHTNNRVRVSTTSVQTLADEVDLLVAFDQEAIDLNLADLRAGGCVLADQGVQPTLPTQTVATLLAIPFSAIAVELGSVKMKNMVALGATLALLKLDLVLAGALLRELLARKGEDVVARNLEALQRGWDAVQALGGEHADLQLAPATPGRRLAMIGNEAVALGALAAGCRFMAAYPITPASDIMEYLIRKLPEFGGAVIQTEDEIAACTMAIGANYAGARAMTASSGPGLSLMVEAIGLAGMTETPLVVVAVQRGGPSTGLPTKHEQSDLLAMLHATHGEIPRIVMAPSTAEEAFYDMVEAFNLAEEYQCPVIVLTDLQLALAKQTVPYLDYERLAWRRGQLDPAPALPETGGQVPCKRFVVTADGISPRFLPGTGPGIFQVTGLEHDEQGRPAEAPANHTAQMDKRLRKLHGLKFREPVAVELTRPQPDLLLVGFNATRGAIAEAAARLRAEGVTVNLAQIRLLQPFPVAELTPLLAGARQVCVIEHNATGQLCQVLRQQVPAQAGKLDSILKYDGTPFVPGELYAQIREVLHHGER